MKMEILPILLLSFAAIGFAQADEKPLKDTKGMVCPVKATEGCDGIYCSYRVQRDIFVEHEGRKVYFCCQDCVEAFKKDPKSFLEKTKEQWKVIDAKSE